MDARTAPTTTLTAGDRLARSNALVLAIGQALAGGNNTVLMATGGIVGAMIAPDRGFATLPISIYVLASGWGRFRSAGWPGATAGARRFNSARCVEC